jgi:serine/threonine protein kinase
MTPNHIGQFEIRYELGSGSFGTVYAAVDTELQRWVAIKTLRTELGSDPAIMQRFRSEGIGLGRLNHTNITTLYGMPRIGEQVFLVMELVNGQPLDVVFHRLRRLGVNEVLAILVQAAAGLGYAHRMGVIHRDIKPSNLMLTDTGVLKIMDFGIARIRGTQRLTRSGLVGTYAYLAPEQFRGGEGNEQSDLYSLACVVHEALTGNIPFDAPTEAEIMRGHLEVPVRPLREVLPDLDPRLDEVVQRALAKDPTQRFATVEEFSDAMGAGTLERSAVSIARDNILARVPAPPRPTTLIEPSSASQAGQHYEPVTDLMKVSSGKSHRTASRHLPALLLGTAGICVIGGVAYLVWQPEQVVDKPDVPAQTASSHTEPPRTPTVPSEDSKEHHPPPNDFFVHPSKPDDPSTMIPPTIPSTGGKPLQAMTVEELISSGRPAADLIAEAERRFRTGNESAISAAIMTLSYTAKTLHSAAAFAAIARIYDPNRSDRPAGLQADASQAAQNYRAAVMEGDTSVVQDREALRAYLKQRALGSGPEAARAAAILDRFWR